MIKIVHLDRPFMFNTIERIQNPTVIGNITLVVATTPITATITTGKPYRLPYLLPLSLCTLLPPPPLLLPL